MGVSTRADVRGAKSWVVPPPAAPPPSVAQPAAAVMTGDRKFGTSRVLGMNFGASWMSKPLDRNSWIPLSDPVDVENPAPAASSSSHSLAQTVRSLTSSVFPSSSSSSSSSSTSTYPSSPLSTPPASLNKRLSAFNKRLSESSAASVTAALTSLQSLVKQKRASGGSFTSIASTASKTLSISSKSSIRAARSRARPYPHPSLRRLSRITPILKVFRRNSAEVSSIPQQQEQHTSNHVRFDAEAVVYSYRRPRSGSEASTTSVTSESSGDGSDVDLAPFGAPVA
ncbi:hypothetical protein HK104_007887, partial [Borealophlyctis nickersoniae]